MPQAAAFFANPLQALDFARSLVSFIQQIIDMFEGANTQYEQDNNSENYLRNLEQTVPMLNQKLADTGIKLVAADRLDSVAEVRELQDILRNILMHAEEYNVSAELRAKLERTISNLDKAAEQLRAQGEINDVNGDGHAVILNRLPANLQPAPGAIDYNLNRTLSPDRGAI
jgi:biotin operon repressor